MQEQGRGLASARDRARLRERERAERARVERVLARGPREVEARPLVKRGPRDAGCVCRACGASEVCEDEVFERGPWRVGRCLRCDHRWMERVAPGFRPAVRRPVRAAGVELCANGA
jgi:hypothetical protein